MTQGVSTHYSQGANLSEFRTAPVRSLPFIPQDFNLTASSAGTQVTIREVEIAQRPPSGNPSTQDAAAPKLEILI